MAPNPAKKPKAASKTAPKSSAATGSVSTHRSTRSTDKKDAVEDPAPDPDAQTDSPPKTKKKKKSKKEAADTSSLIPPVVHAPPNGSDDDQGPAISPKKTGGRGGTAPQPEPTPPPRTSTSPPREQTPPPNMSVPPPHVQTPPPNMSTLPPPVQTPAKETPPTTTSAIPSPNPAPPLTTTTPPPRMQTLQPNPAPPPPRVDTPPPSPPPRVDTPPPSPPPRVNTPPPSPPPRVDTPPPSPPPPPPPPPPPLPPSPPPPHNGEVLRNLGSHCERNPDGPKQPEKPPRSKDKMKGSAETNTATLACKQKKAARADLAAAVRDFEKEVDEQAVALAATLQLPVEEVRAALGHATKFKKKRAYNEFSAKVWKRTTELNEDKAEGKRLHLADIQEIVKNEPEETWSPEDLAQLKLDFLAHKAAEDIGTRKTNADAAKDVTYIGDRIHEELVLLENRTGARGYCVLGGSNVNDTITPTVLGTPESCAFIPDILKMDTGTLALKFQRYSTLKDSGPPKDATKRRSEVVEMIERELRKVTGKSSVKMEYVHYERVIQGDLGYEFKWWPEGMAIVAPSKFGSGASDGIMSLWERLTDGSCTFVPVEPRKHAKIQEKYKNYKKRDTGKKKGTRRGKSDAESEVEAEETEPEEVKGKSKKRARVEDDGEEEAPRKKKKKTVKFAADDEGDVQEKKGKKKRTEGVEAPKTAIKRKLVGENPSAPKKKKPAKAAPVGSDTPADEPAPDIPKKAFSKRHSSTTVKTPEFVPSDADDDLDEDILGTGSGDEGGEDKGNAAARFQSLKKKQAADRQKAAASKERMLKDMPRPKPRKQSNAVAGPSTARSLKDIEDSSSYEDDDDDDDD
ncbi:hypothetical protein C8R44DRAFT_741990 [Mycena epipterygia]|nr:hypothetical protein C8R44DRAFT_741990 [Mycena epipterygia]